MGREDGGTRTAVRNRFGVIALSPGHTKVALVRPAGGDSSGGDGGSDADGASGWQFPSALPSRELERLEDQLGVALEVADNQLGFDVADYLCSQPVIHALGPEPRVSTKFFMAFNVPVGAAPLAPPGGGQAAWHDLQALLDSTADAQVAGNQLVAVLRQLQGMIKRRYEMVMPADDGYQDVAALMSWHEAVQSGESADGGVAPWQGISPKEFVEQHCRAHQLPAPCFNVFERDRSAARTHFCATCLLPHLSIQITPDAVYASPLDALENCAVLAALYMAGALGPDCPLVHFAAAGEMAQVPHAFVTEQEARREARQQRGKADRHKRELERKVEEERAAVERRVEELRRQQARLATGDLPPLGGPGPRAGAPGGGGVAPLGGPPGLLGGPDRPAKRLRQEKGPVGLTQALQQLPRDKHPLMAIKELCDKCRFPLPLYEELPAGGGTVVAVTLPQAGVPRTLGPPHEDRKQAKVLAVQMVLDMLRRRLQG